jgi:PEP-CTERM motif
VGQLTRDTGRNSLSNLLARGSRGADSFKQLALGPMVCGTHLFVGCRLSEKSAMNQNRGNELAKCSFGGASVMLAKGTGSMRSIKAIMPATAAALAALSLAPAAEATVIHVGGATTGAPADASYQFELTNGSTPFSPVITARYSADYGPHSGDQAVDDSFVFTIPQNGLGSGNFSTSFTVNSNEFTLTDILFNGQSFFDQVTVGPHGWSLSIADPLQITANVQNVLEIIGSVRGINGYSGNLTFASEVPEATSWSMLLIGFGAVGIAYRRRRTVATVALG